MILKWQKKLILSLISFIFMVSPCFAQTKQSQLTPEQKEALEQIRKQMREDQRKINEIFNKNFLDKIGKMFFGKEGDPFDHLQDMFKDENMAPFFQQYQNMMGPKTTWKEFETGVVLIIHGKPANDQPFDIKLKDEFFQVKGTIESINEIKNQNHYQMRKSIQTFHHQFPIPDKTEPKKMTVELKDKELWVIFPKVGKKWVSPAKKPAQKPKKGPQKRKLTPIGPNSEDEII